MRTVTPTGSMRARPPTVPATAARRSCVTTPTSRPRTPSLNDDASFATTVVIAAVLIGAFALVGTSRVGNVVEAQASLPWENYQFVANFAKSSGINYVYTDTAHPGALFYYMGPRRVRWLHERAVKEQAYCAVKNRFIFVDDTYHQTVKPDLRCLLSGRHAQKFDVPQQLNPPIRRPGRLTIYLVPAARQRR